MIKQPNIFATIGSGFGQGLAEQLPKEIDRARLSQGLRDIGNMQDANPFQQFAALAGVPGITPQMLASGSDLLRQQAQIDSIRNQGDIQNQPRTVFPGVGGGQGEQPSSNVPSLTKSDVFERTQEGFIPLSQQEKTARAAQVFNENPGFFKNDPQMAMQYVDQEEAQREKQAQAFQNKHQNLSNIQDKVVNRLGSHAEKLGAEIPADLYSAIEDKAIQATKPIKDGGRGLDEHQAMKEYGKEMDDASRNFANLSTVGNWGIAARPAKSTFDQIQRIQNEMEKIDQTENMALKLISDSKLSPGLAFSLSQPVNKVPELNKFLKGLPNLSPTETLFETVGSPQSFEKSMEIADQIGEYVKAHSNASPQAIAYELDKKGYDGQAILNHLSENSKRFNLRQRQLDQLNYPKQVGTFNDWWLQSFSGIR